MRNWGKIVTGFYILVIAALSPVLVIVGVNIGEYPALRGIGDIGEQTMIFGGWAVLLVGGPLVLLSVSVDSSQIQLRRRRHVFVSALAAGFSLALLIAAGASNLYLALPKSTRETVEGAAGDALGWIVVAACLGFWLAWTLVLWRMGERLMDPATRIYGWLIKGSVLELLVAIPSHIIVRQRNECTAPEVTSFGVVTGIAILLMSLGPGALFLYRARMRSLSQPPKWRASGQ